MRFALATGLVLAGCTGRGQPIESDSVDTDADQPDHALEGLTTVTITADGVPICDFDLAMISVAAYTGECRACDFAFYVDTEIVRNDWIDACRSPLNVGRYSWLEGFGGYDDRWIGFSDYYRRDDELSFTVWSNELHAGWEDEHSLFSQHIEHFGYDGTLVWARENGFGVASFDGGALTFAGSDYRYDRPWHYGDAYCTSSEVTHLPAPDEMATESTGVDDSLCWPVGREGIVDVWQFEIEGPSAFTVTVDSVDASAAMGTALQVLDPDGCEIAVAGESLECTSWPDEPYTPEHCYTRQCPGWSGRATAEQAGVFTAIVAPGRCCVSGDQEVGTYRIGVAGARPGSLALTHDDVPYQTRYELTIAGSAHVNPTAAP